MYRLQMIKCCAILDHGGALAGSKSTIHCWPADGCFREETERSETKNKCLTGFLINFPIRMVDLRVNGPMGRHNSVPLGLLSLPDLSS